MGDAQSVPVLGEVVTVAKSTTQMAAVGACALFGKDEAANRFAEGFGKTWKDYSEKNLVVGTVNASVQKIKGNHEEAARIAERSLKSFGGFVDNVSVVGHAKGIVHYAAGDTEHGNRCMIGASRSTLVAGAGALTGGLGGGVFLGGVAGAEAGVAYDMVHSKIDSDIHNEKRYHGLIGAIDQYQETGDPNNILDGGLGVVGDFATGAVSAYAAENAVDIEQQQDDPITEYETPSDAAVNSRQQSIVMQREGNIIMQRDGHSVIMQGNRPSIVNNNTTSIHCHWHCAT